MNRPRIIVNSAWSCCSVGTKHAALALVVAGAVFACAEGATIDPPANIMSNSGGSSSGSGAGSLGTGGSTGSSGGTTSLGNGGSTSVGGTTSSAAGAVNSGGISATGGGTASVGGGATAGGTNKATGGATGGGSNTTGGVVATAGSKATGGVVATAGSVATGGVTAAAGSSAAAGSVSTGGVVATGGSTAVSTGLRLELRNCDGTCNPTGQSIWLYLQLVNAGTTSISTADLKVRYYYTDATVDKYDNYFSSINTVTVTATFAALATPTTTADHYVELSFSAGSIAAGATFAFSGQAHSSTWNNLNQVDDYSYSGSTSYAANDKVTVYQGTTLIWGTEP